MMASGVQRDEAWLSDAFKSATPDVHFWLVNLRNNYEDYEDWTVPNSTPNSTDTPDFDHFELHKYFHNCESDKKEENNAFDNILKSLGDEIYQLESYQKRNSYQRRNTVPSEVEQTIMQIFDSCIEECCKDALMELKVPTIEKIPSFSNISILSDEVFLKSAGSSRNGSNSNLTTQANESQANSSNCNINHIFYKGTGAPVPPKRKNRQSNPNEQYDNIDIEKPKPTSKMEQLQSKLAAGKNDRNSTIKTDSDSGNNSPASDNSDYQSIWHCTSGSRKPTIRSGALTFKENYGLINTISFDTAKDIPHSSLDLGKQRFVICKQSRIGKSDGGSSSTTSVNSTNSEGAALVPFGKHSTATKRYSYDGRKFTDSKMVHLSEVKCTSECDLADECHQDLAHRRPPHPKPMARRAQRENIYENVQCLKSGYVHSDTDLRRPLSDVNLKSDEEYNSSSVEIVSDSDSWRTPVEQRRTTSTSTDYASESPIYENLEDLRLTRPLTSDVVAWKALLLDPYWNEDEEDEWITDEQASVYSKDQKPPYVIPRIKPFKHKPPTSNHRHSKEVHHVDEEPKSPTMRDVRRMFEEGAFNKANSESPKFPRLQPRMGGSTETLAVRMAYSPQEPSPIELRQNADSGSRYSKAKSLVTPERKEQMNRSYTIVQKPLLPKLYDPKSSVMLEHLLYRTKLTDNGKKVKKNWQYNYAVLTQTALMFYKDQKAYQSAKLSSANIQPDAFVLLMGALVADGTPQQTKRRNPIVITSNKQQHILQHDEPLIIRDWFDHIRKAINKLPSDYVCPDNSKIGINTLGSPSPTHRRISGTKSSSKDEPVFGRSLDQVCPDTNPQVPEFVTHCIKAIEASEENMRADGLYRASGNLSQVQKIRLEVDQNNLLVLDKDIDVHVLTGALKLFFRELKEPLIPFKFFQKTLNASSNPVAESRTKEFREIVHGLPECNKQTLQYLLEHLLRVTYRKEHNRMHISNLAIVLGPTLLWAPSESSHNLAIDCLQQNQVIEILLSDFDKIFKEEGKRK
ncbi:uncharacterized protein LOC143913861 isoform X2 [Arctopsyche grandis]|uniref:uncharacterized protein LOC143913861 isoform X2 n=1 Tax=Arctopsyche grandis TaxID=121162 RepID=UPI00406D8693